MAYTVYMHINKTNNKKYVGITSQKPNKRWDCGRGYLRNRHFNSSIKKYGWDGFEHIIVKDNLPEQCARTLEILLIKQYDTVNPNKGYNLTLGGEAAAGSIRSEEHKRILSESNKNKIVSDDTRQKISDSRKGKHLSYTARKKIAEAKSKAISKYDLNMNYLCTYSSLTEAALSVNGRLDSISKVLKSNGKYKGYIWKLED